MNLGWRLYYTFITLLFVYLLVLQIQAIWPLTIDDMFISLRYAKHWASGEGLLWNIGAPPVEGYSNFSFVVLSALAIYFKANPVLLLKWMGVIGLVFTSLFLYLITRFGVERRFAFIPSLFLLFYKGQIIWSVSGLETTVYQALLCGGVYFIFRGLGYAYFPKPKEAIRPLSFLISGLILSFAAMTRPEAPALIAVFFVLICWEKTRSTRKEKIKGIVLFCVPLLIIYAPYFFWRWHFYGFLFPNPVYCKGFSEFSLALDAHFLKLIWPFALLAIPACIHTEDKRHYFLWLPSVVYLLMLINADGVVAFANRLFLPAFALLLPLSFQGIHDLVLNYTKKQKEVFIWSLLISSFCALILFIPKMTLAEYRYFTLGPIAGEQLRKKVADWLSIHAGNMDSIVLADAGLIPYSMNNVHVIDSYCLNNISIAHDKHRNRYEHFCHDIMQKKPGIIILTSLIEKGKVTYTPSDLCLKKNLIHSSYNLSESFATDNQDSIYRYEMFSLF